MPTFNQERVLNRLETLVNIPSPSGFTDEIMQWVEEEFNNIGLSTERTHKGAVIAKIEGADSSQARLLTAHVDTLGAMVKEIKPNGRLKLSKIGGFNWNAVEGEYCQIHPFKAKPLTGTILMHETSVHVYKGCGELPRDDEHMEVRIDAKTQSKEETEKLGIQVGDFVSFNPNFEVTPTGFVKSRHLDDKASVSLLFALAESLVSRQIELPYTLYFYISNNEEIGFGGNASIPPEVKEYIAVDMGAIGDGQASDEYTVSICAKDSSGPYHYRLTRGLTHLATTHKIPYKLDIYPYYGSDASAAIRAGFDIRHGLFGPGIESSHAQERTHIDSLKATYELLFAYVRSKMSD